MDPAATQIELKDVIWCSSKSYLFLLTCFKMQSLESIHSEIDFAAGKSFDISSESRAHQTWPLKISGILLVSLVERMVHFQAY